MKFMVIGPPAALLKPSSCCSSIKVTLVVLLVGCTVCMGVDAESLSPSATLLPSLTPTVSYHPSPSPTMSLHPSSTPSTSFDPTDSVRPSIAPSTSTIPSMNPTTLPSLSQEPSERPSLSHEPSESHSPSISSLPSKAPTVRPTTLPPTNPPEPSMSPSISPLPTVTVSPSVVPTMSMQPSATPSISFVPSVSSAPSMPPSESMKPSISKSPSAIPSVRPTKIPTTIPSDIPSLMPSTPNPSFFPSFLPTVQPSLTPSVHPSSLPSSSPTRVMSVAKSGTIQMKIIGLASIRAPSRQKKWEDATSDHVVTFWNQRKNVDIVVASVSTALIEQIIDQESAGRFLKNESKKETSVTTFVYNQTVIYSERHSLDEEGIVQTLTLRPFKHDFQRYADVLAGFASADDDIVFGGITGDSNPPAPSPDKNDDSGISGGAIAGAFFAVLFGLFIILGIVYFLRRGQQKKAHRKNSSNYNLEARKHDIDLEPLDLSAMSVPVVNLNEKKASMESDDDIRNIESSQQMMTAMTEKAELESQNVSNLQDPVDNVSDLSVNGLVNVAGGPTQAENADTGNHEQHNVSFEIPAATVGDVSEGPMATQDFAFGMQISHIDDLEDLE